MIDAPKTEINLISTTATVTVLDPFQISKILNISWYCISKNLRGINCSPSRRRNDIDRVVPNYTMTYDIHIWLLIKTCYSVLKLKTQHNKDWQWMRSISKPRVNPLFSFYWWRTGIDRAAPSKDEIIFGFHGLQIRGECASVDCTGILTGYNICLTVRCNTIIVRLITNLYMLGRSLTVRCNTIHVRLITQSMFGYDRPFQLVYGRIHLPWLLP